MGKIMLNGKQYGVGGIEKAKDISYDNTSSGMSATNVQGALDEVKAGLNNKILVKEFINKTTTSGAFFIEANELPAGVTTSSHWFIAQPMYGSTALLGYAIALQMSGARIACYVRQGTTLPADGSRVVFNLFCIKKAN